MRTSTIIRPKTVAFRCQLDRRGGKPWLVFVNSLMTSLELWDDQADAFSDAFSVLRFDQRGHGESDVPAGPYNFTQLSEDLVDIFDALAIKQANIVGISMGGTAALMFAHRWPQRVSSLTICDARDASHPSLSQAWEDRINAVRCHGSMEALAEPTLRRWLHPRTFTESPAAVAKIGAMIRSTPVEGFINSAAALCAFDYSPVLKQIRVPTLVMVGAQDGDRPSQMCRMSKEVLSARFVEIDAAGHLPNIERPQAFNQALGDFLRDVTHGNFSVPDETLVSRLPLNPVEDLNLDQRRVFDEIATSRGSVRGPFLAWLHSPEFAHRAQHLGFFLRHQTSLPARLSELAILTVARSWSAQYEWFAHVKCAREAGLSEELIGEIGMGQRPDFSDVAASVVYDFTRSLLLERRIDDDLFRNAVACLGIRGVVELVGIVGYYSMIAMTVNTFHIQAPDGPMPQGPG